MAVLKRIKFGNKSNDIQFTEVKPANGGVITATGAHTDLADGNNPEYVIDLTIANDGTLVKENNALKVGTVPAAQVSVAEGAGITSTTAQAAFKELKDEIDAVDGAAKSYKIVAVAEPAITSQAEYKIQEKTGDGAWGDVTGSSPIVVPKDNAFVTAQLGHDGAIVDASTGTITDGSGEDALLIEYVNGSGVYTLVAVPIGAFLKESEFKDGLQVNGNGEVSVKIDSTSEGFLTVSADGVKLSGVQTAIDNAVDALDVTDTAVTGQYVSAVNETNGKVSMTRANVSDAVLTGYAKGTKPASTAIAATDDVKGAIAKLEHQIDDAEAAATTKVVEGTDEGNNMTIASATSETDGSTTYTINLTDVASKTALDAEIAARKAVDGQNGQTYAANGSANYISGATSLNDADVKLDAAIKAEVDRANSAETAIDSAIGLTKDASGETRTWTGTTNYGKSTVSVKDNMQALDTQLKTVSDNLAAVKYEVTGTTLEFFGIDEKTGA